MASAPVLMMAVVVAMRKPDMTSEPVVLWFGNASSPAQVLPRPPAIRPAHQTKGLHISGHLLREVLPADEKRGRTARNVYRQGIPLLTSKSPSNLQEISHSHWKRKNTPNASHQKKPSNTSKPPRTHRKRGRQNTARAEGDVPKMPRPALIHATALRIPLRTTKKNEKREQAPKPRKIHVPATTRTHRGNRKDPHNNPNVVPSPATETSVGDPCVEWPKNATVTVRGRKLSGTIAGSTSGVTNHTTKPPRLEQNKRSPKKATMSIRGSANRDKPGYSYPSNITKTARRATTSQRKKELRKNAALPSTSFRVTTRSGLAEANFKYKNLDKSKQQTTLLSSAAKIEKVTSPTTARRPTAKHFSNDKRTTPKFANSHTNIETHRKRPIPAAQPDTARASSAATTETPIATKLPPTSDHRKELRQKREPTNQDVNKHDSGLKLSTHASIQHPNPLTRKPARARDLLQQIAESVKQMFRPTLRTSQFKVTASPRSPDAKKFQRMQTTPSTRRGLPMTTILPSLLTVENLVASPRETARMSPPKVMMTKMHSYRPTGSPGRRRSQQLRRRKWMRREYQRKSWYHHHQRRRYRKVRRREKRLQDRRHLSKSPFERPLITSGGKEGQDKDNSTSPVNIKTERKEKSRYSSTTGPKKTKGEKLPEWKPPAMVHIVRLQSSEDSIEAPRKLERNARRQ